MFYFFFFFFSSRRRHTRSLRDWSSDVCSSDLSHPIRSPPLHDVEAGRPPRPSKLQLPGSRPPTRPASSPVSLSPKPARSEERRVGKECRSRWSRYHERKKSTANKRQVEWNIKL